MLETSRATAVESRLVLRYVRRNHKT